MRIPPQNMMKNLANLTTTLEKLGIAVDEGSAGGKQVTKAEAQTMLQGLDALPAADKALVVDGLKLALQQDLFVVDDDTRALFAESLNVPVRDLSPGEVLDQAGVESRRTQFEHSLKVLTKAPRVTKKLLQELFTAMDAAPPFLQALLTDAVFGASKDGDIKLDTNARAPMRKKMAEPEIRETMGEFEEIQTARPQNPYAARLSKLLAEGGTFEDILAAFMLMMVANMEMDMAEKMKELQRVDEELNKRELNKTQVKQEQQDQLDTTLGVADFDEHVAGQTAQVVQKVVNAADTALKRDYETARVKKDDQGNVLRGPDGRPQMEYIGKHGEGIINRNEAMRIASKLEELTVVGPPADHLMAASITHALLSSPDLPAGKNSDLGPILEWGQKVLKQYDVEVDIEKKIDPGEAQSANSPLAGALRGAEGIPGKLASYIVDVFTNKDEDLGTKMKGLKTASDIVMQHAEGDKAARSAGPKTDAAAATDAAPTPDAPNADYGDQSTNQVHRSRTLIAEEIKSMTQDIQQVLQALSNIMNMLHQNAMNSIRSIR